MNKISFAAVSAVAFLLMACVCFAEARAEEGSSASQATTLDDLKAAAMAEKVHYERHAEMTMKLGSAPNYIPGC